MTSWTCWGSRSSGAERATEIKPLRKKSGQSIFTSSAKTAEIYMKKEKKEIYKRQL